MASRSKSRPLLDLVKEQWKTPVQLEPFAGWMVGKIPADFNHTSKEDGKLILVTAMSPTKFGEGKTCTSVGLTDALRRIGKKATVCLREPSLGPVFGMKGGAAGGGLSQLVPMDQINLHFTGDIHAVGSSHNLLSAMIDNEMHFNSALQLDPRRITFRRVMDMNDRALRQIVIGLGGPLEGVPRQNGFDITVASEVMAILCLATDLQDLQERLGRIVVGRNYSKNLVTAKDLQANGAMTALLTHAFRPNVVQSLENTLAFIHGGPFANIAHGCSSVVATKAGKSVADYVVTEAGFGADLGAEKFLHIKCRQAGLKPSCSVVVATVRAMKQNGNGDLQAGFCNLQQHVENLNKFGLKTIVAINQFPTDTEEELNMVVKLCNNIGVEAVRASHYSTGSAGAEDLAKRVVALSTGEEKPINFMYDLSDKLETKVEAVAREIYRADKVEFSIEAKKQLDQFTQDGFGNLPVCIAKTQYSFSDNAALVGAPRGHTLHVQEARLSAGAGFIVILTGSVMTMPGLPKSPASTRIGVNNEGKIYGLF